MGLNPQEYSLIATSPMRVLTFSAYGIGRLCAAIPNVRNRLGGLLPSAAPELHRLRDRLLSRAPVAGRLRRPLIR